MNAARIVDVADNAISLSVRDAQLRVRLAGGGEMTTPLSELAALVISNPAVTMTQAVIAGVAEGGGATVICDRKHLPAAVMLPVQVHVTQTERFSAQVRMTAPLRKRLWQRIVIAKIRAQARLLDSLHGDDSGLAQMAARVRSGDGANLEGQAAQRYWPRLFRDPHFRRGREGPDQNSHLNYGYAVLRAVVARALCGAGLHPSLGLQHHNRYDPFCLANDLMEPFRPIVDRAVYLWVQDHAPSLPLDREAKAALLRPIMATYEWQEESRTLFDWLSRTATSLAKAVMNSDPAQLEIPEA